MNPAITFKRLEYSDFPLLHKWLNTDFVRQWYKEKDVSHEGISKRFGRFVDHTEPTNGYIIQINAKPIGYIQTYKIRDYPEYASLLPATGHSAGIDLFIGEKDYIHKGFGPQIIRQFLKEIVFVNPGIKDCIIGPEPDNKGAIRAYEKAGFKYIKTIQVPEEDAPEYIMRIERSNAP